MLHEIDAGDLIDFARRWADLGDAVADQVSQVVDDPRAAAGLRHADLEVNPLGGRAGRGVSGRTPVDDFIAYIRTAPAEEVEQAEALLARLADRCYLVGHINRVTLALREPS